LADELLFGDVAPSWKGAPTGDAANRERLGLIKRLRRFSLDFDGAVELAARLEACRPSCRCTSGACPECTRAFQRWLVAQMQRLSQHNLQHSTGLVAVSIVSSAWRAKPGYLHSLDVGEIRKSLRETIYGTELVEWAVFGLDVSVNDDTNKGLDLAWQIQFFGVAKVKDRLAFSKYLRRTFRTDSRVRRPVVVRECDGTDLAFSYVFKPRFIRRVSYWGDGATGTGAPRKCWRTRKVSLKAREEVELRLFLHRIGVTKRVPLIGLKVARTGAGFHLTKKKLE